MIPQDDHISEWIDAVRQWKADRESDAELRDHFAAAALTGLLASDNYTRSTTSEEHAVVAYELADAMLRQRNPVTEPTPVFVSGSGSVTPVSYQKSDEKRVNRPTNRGACGAVDEPVAWAVVSDGTDEIDCEFIYPDEATAGDVALDFNCGVVPLYRQPKPVLTDAEREAIVQAIGLADWNKAYFSHLTDVEPLPSATLRSLLERLR